MKPSRTIYFPAPFSRAATFLESPEVQCARYSETLLGLKILKNDPHLIRITCWSVVKYMKTDFYRLYRHKFRVTFEGPASRPLLPPFEEFIFKNLTVRCGSKTVFSGEETKNELPKLTVRFYKINSSNSGKRGRDAGPSKVSLKWSVYTLYTFTLRHLSKATYKWGKWKQLKSTNEKQ